MRLTLSILATAAALAACSSTPAPVAYAAPSYESAMQNPFITSGRAAMDEIVRGFDMAQLGQAPVLVATVVNVNDLSRSAPLGRTLSEIYASQLASKGFNVKELKLRGDVYVKEGAGELLLSREIRDIAQNHNAGLVLVGTYSQATQYTYLSLKLVRTADSRIIRSHDYALPNDQDVQRLLGKSASY
ncbi:MAG: FlgO family outer membrane protein [Comamonas sp.]